MIIVLLETLVENTLPDWKVRLYHNYLNECDLKCKLKDKIEFCNENDLKLNGIKLNFNISKWLPLGDNFIDSFLVMSLSDISKYKEQIQSWVNSKNIFNIIRENPDFAIQDGLWGFSNAKCSSLATTLKDLLIKNVTQFNSDSSAFLSKLFWNYAVTNSSIYDNYYCSLFGRFPFPTNVSPKFFCNIFCYNCCQIEIKQQKVMIPFAPKIAHLIH